MALKAGEFQKFGREYIRQAYQELLGREPTEIEISQAFPSLGNDPNIHNVSSLRAYVAGQKQITDTGTKQAEEQRKLAENQATLLQGLLEKQTKDTETFRESQRQRGLSEIEGISNIRRTRRDELAKILSSQVDQDFKNAIPQIAEDANTKGILTSTGYGEALARERSRLSERSNLELAKTGLSDLDAEASLRESLAAGGLDSGQQSELARLSGERNVLSTRLSGAERALTTSQGSETDALSRGFSIEDFQRQAQVAKELAKEASPQGGGGKGQAGSLLSGIGAIATPLVALSNPGLGAGLAGSQVVAKTAQGNVTRSQTARGGGK